jgi:hypothetical protein
MIDFWRRSLAPKDNLKGYCKNPNEKGGILDLRKQERK